MYWGQPYAILTMGPEKMVAWFQVHASYGCSTPSWKVRAVFAARSPTSHSALCWLPALSLLLDSILDCSVLSRLFDASLSLGAAQHPPCGSNRHSLDQLCPLALHRFFFCVPTNLPVDGCHNDDSALVVPVSEKTLSEPVRCSRN